MWHALIRTHHITSRYKVSRLRQAAKRLGVYAVVRNGGPPGVMYVEGPRESVEDWIDEVRVRAVVGARRLF